MFKIIIYIILLSLDLAFADDCILLSKDSETIGKYCCKLNGDVERSCTITKDVCRVGIIAGFVNYCTHSESSQKVLLTVGNGSSIEDFEHKIEEKLERSKSVIEKHKFKTDRDLSNYVMTFPIDFLMSLNNLSSSNVWLDSGSGECHAIFGLFDSSISKKSLDNYSKIIDDYKSFDGEGSVRVLENQMLVLRTAIDQLDRKETDKKPNVIGVTYKMNGTVPKDNSKIKVLTGRFLEDIPEDEIGTVDLITDLYGVLSYTHSVDMALQKYLNLLSQNGTIYFEGGSSLRNDRTEIHTRDGQRMSLVQWLASNPTIQSELVEVEPRLFNNEPNYIVKIMRKPGVQPQIPPLTLTEIREDAPPKRVFTEK